MSAPQGEKPVEYTTQPPRSLSYEQYLAAVAVVVAGMSAVIAGLAAPYQRIALTRRDWVMFLASAYPYVEEARRRIAVLSREFYDSERAKHVGPIDVPLLDEPVIFGPDDRPINFTDASGLTVKVWERVPINLIPYKPEWFEEAMEAEVIPFRRPEATDKDVAKAIGRAQKEAEYAGRRQTMWAVDDDPRVRGWARVEGNENIGSCGFCAMLISRGPVYTDSPEYAGLNERSTSRAVEVFKQAQATGDDSELMGLMNRWHPNCDCKVVPVFAGGTTSWPGYEQYRAMEALWAEVMADFKEEFGRAPGQGDVGRGGSAREHEALNAFRKRLERGDLPAGIRRPRNVA